MKKTILIVLMVLVVVTPCLAQEVETDGLFSIAGTAWRCIGVRNNWFSFLMGGSLISLYDEIVYFTDRSVLTTSGTIGILQDMDTYLDFLVFSVAWREYSHRTAQYPGYMILQPALGVGVFNSIIWQSFCWNACGDPFPIGVGFGFMFKIDDDDW